MAGHNEGFLAFRRHSFHTCKTLNRCPQFNGSMTDNEIRMPASVVMQSDAIQLQQNNNKLDKEGSEWARKNSSGCFIWLQPASQPASKSSGSSSSTKCPPGHGAGPAVCWLQYQVQVSRTRRGERTKLNCHFAALIRPLQPLPHPLPLILLHFTSG